MTEEYELKEEIVGQLYPVLKDAKGNVIDGRHRLARNRKWRQETLKHIDTKEKFLVARIVANARTYDVSLPMKDWINELAEEYYQQGIEPGKISGKIADITGYAHKTVLGYLEDKYKNMSKAGIHVRTERTSPISVAEKKLGKPLFQKVKKEIRQELKPEIEKEVKVELLDEARKRETVEDKILDEMSEQYVPAIKKAFTNASNSNLGKDYRNSLVLGMVLRNLKSGVIFCPICGKPSMLEWTCCHRKLDELGEEILHGIKGK